MKTIDALVNAVTTHHKWTLAFVLIVTVIMSFFYIRQQQDNNIGVFFEDGDVAYTRYMDFVNEYGSEEFVILAYKDEQLFTNEMIRLSRELSDELKRIKGVERVVGLTDVEEVIGQEDAIVFKKIIPEGELSAETLGEISDKVVANPMIRGGLISGDGKTAAILVELEALSNQDKFATLDEIVRISKAVTKDAIKLYYTGIPVLERETNRLSQQDIRTFFVATSILLFLIIVLLFKNLTLAVLSMLTVFLTQLWGIGFFVLCGEKLNWVTSTMIPIFLAIAIADSVHLISHFLKIHVPGKSDIHASISEATKTVYLPCLLTTLTTCVGFISFTTSPLRPSCVMGIFTAIGVFFAFVIDVTFLPAALTLMRERISESLIGKIRRASIIESSLLHGILTFVGRFSTTYIKSIAILFAAIFLVSIIGMTKLKFETNSSNYLHDSNEVKKDSLFLDQNLGGAIPFMVLVQSTGDSDFADPYALGMAEKVQRLISDHDKEYVTKSTSIVDYVKEGNRAFNNNDEAYYRIPDARSDILDFYELGDSEILQRLISDDKKEVCITFLSKWGTNERAVESGSYYKKTIGDALGGDFTFLVTGITTLYIAMEEMLKTSQQRSFSVAFILIFLMMLFVCKNVKLALISMVPNIFPIVLTLGLMGWLEIPLDAATIMIASVTLGIAVDDTIHFLAWYRRFAGAGLTAVDAIRNTFMVVGKPITTTTVLLFCGFGVFIVGHFTPTQTFGVLTAFSMLFALIGDFLILPALILLCKPLVKPDMRGIHPAEGYLKLSN